MIGIISGEIIGSPYSKNNTKSPNDIFFPLFEATRKGYFYNPKVDKDSRKVENIDDLDKREQRGYSYRENKYEPKPGSLSASARSVAEMYLDGNRNLEDYADGNSLYVNPLIAAVVCGMREENQSMAVETAVSLAIEVEPERKQLLDVSAMASLTWSAFHGGKREDLERIAANNELNINIDQGNLRALLTGMIVPSDKPGVYTRGEGEPLKEGGQVVAAALQLTLQSGSWEEAVRRAVAIGGESSLLAALTGGLAEGVHGEIPGHILARTKDFLERDTLQIVEQFERKVEGQEQIQTAIDESNLIQFKVLSNGTETVYVIPEDETEVIHAVRNVRESSGRTFEYITPEKEGEVIERMSIQKHGNNVLSGTYIEGGRLDERTLFYDRFSKGIYSLSTVPSASMASFERRALEIVKFYDLARYAENVRCELEAKVGHDSSVGHIHFASAFYPVVGKDKVELWQGDVLRARIRINEKGLLRVDTNVHTGSLLGEYIEGALNSTELAKKNMGVAEFKSLLGEYCLNYGAILDEEERKTLSEGGMDADVIKEINKLNVDKANRDLLETSDERLVIKDKDKEEDKDKNKDKDLDKDKEEASGIEQSTESVLTEKEIMDRMMSKSKVGDMFYSRSHPGSIFTIGHSTMSKEEMLGLLKRYGIEVVLDIRSYSFSKYNSQFNDKPFSAFLESNGIGYEWFGDVFGGKMYHDKDKQSKMTYEEILSKDRAQENLKVIRDAVKDGTRIALMCSEGEPSQCHRFAMMGYALEHPSDGKVESIPVQHILRNGNLISQTQLEKTMLRTMGLTDSKENLKKAFQQKCMNLLEKTPNDNAIRLKRKR